MLCSWFLYTFLEERARSFQLIILNPMPFEDAHNFLKGRGKCILKLTGITEYTEFLFHCT
jgi:hypothetical protein